MFEEYESKIRRIITAKVKREHVTGGYYDGGIEYEITDVQVFIDYDGENEIEITSQITAKDLKRFKAEFEQFLFEKDQKDRESDKTDYWYDKIREDQLDYTSPLWLMSRLKASKV
jgi:hypothetical protein